MAATRTPLIAGNWKMNGLSADALSLVEGLVGQKAAAGEIPFEMAVCPPAPLIPLVAKAVNGSGIGVGGQDCHAAEKGAHTGDVSADLLADLGCGYVIVGHSERRTDHDETDADVRAKAARAQQAGLSAIICIGETEAERDAGETLAVVRRQLSGSVPEAAAAANTVIAYEPVWAIGTGKTPTAADVQDVHAAIRSHLSGLVGDSAQDIRVLYGGSMKPANAAELLALEDVDGGLIGGASLDAESFWAIGEAVGKS